jgi:hypothetical protein
MRCAAVAASAALALSGLAACGDADPDPTDPPTAPATEAPANGDADNGASPTPAESDVELFEFTITGGVADPPLDRVTVEQGTTVRIVVISDEPDELHLHGYDLYADVGPGQEGVLEFVADQTGLFELETHDTHQVLLQLAVR